MLSRRAFNQLLAATATSPLLGCAKPKPQIIKGPERAMIDMHAHVFNARDIPVKGFVEQMILRNPDDRPVAQPALRGLIDFVEFLARLFTSSAAEELSAMQSPALFDTRAATLPDQAKLEQAIDGFAARARLADDGADAADAAFLAELAQLAPPEFRAVPTDDDPFGLNSAAISAAVYDGSADRNAAPLLSDDGPRNPTLASTLRWAVLLTRDRRDILADLIRYYGHGDQVEVFVTSMLDFDLWLNAPDIANWTSPIADQLELMARICQTTTSHAVLNFAPFCPLRAALHDQESFALLDHARENLGLAGIKIYPPVGFKPHGNSGMLGGKEKASGEKINKALRKLYAWCVTHDVPIKSHANNTLAAFECSALNASPALWRKIFDRPEYATLRVNAAHFGGFEEEFDKANPRCPVPGKGFDLLTAEIGNEYPHLYADLGFWTEATTMPGKTNPAVVTRALEVLAANPDFADKLMYGSDWSMIARLNGYESYLVDVEEVIRTRGLDLDAIFFGNAQSYLGLDRSDRPAYQRLAAFYPEGHAFHKIFKPGA